jgi:hypothetical protein
MPLATLPFQTAQLSKYLREVALSHVSKSQLFIRAFAKALEVSQGWKKKRGDF